MRTLGKIAGLPHSLRLRSGGQSVSCQEDHEKKKCTER
jgi:hypothetical protein